MLSREDAAEPSIGHLQLSAEPRRCSGQPQWQRLYETAEHVVAQRLLIVQRLIRDFVATRAGDEGRADLSVRGRARGSRGGILRNGRPFACRRH